MPRPRHVSAKLKLQPDLFLQMLKDQYKEITEEFKKVEMNAREKRILFQKINDFKKFEAQQTLYTRSTQEKDSVKLEAGTLFSAKQTQPQTSPTFNESETEETVEEETTDMHKVEELHRSSQAIQLSPYALQVEKAE